jgi:cytochrome c556
MINRTVLAVAALAIGVTAVAAQDVIAERKALMKQQGAQAAQGAKFMKGEEPFDLAKARNIFMVWAQTAEKIPALFPDNSKTGDTAALPAIWEKKDEYNALAAKLAADSKAALDSVKDEASFKTTFPEVLKDCGGCHRPFRKPQS